MWINYPVLSNAHPTFTAAQQAPLAIQFAAGGTVSSASGPQAAKCAIDGNDSTPTLLLYSTPPYKFQAEDINSNKHPGSCTPA
jgi:hypothetical protein